MYKKKCFPSGPVLFTDFRGVENAADAKDRILATIQPLFLLSFSQLFDGRGIKCFLHFYRFLRSVFIVFIFLLDKLPHKLKLVKEVALELSLRKGEEEKVVMWILDSFSTLVSNATRDLNSNHTPSVAAYSGVITTLFDLNTSIIPIAVCSSATTAGALSESKSYFVPFSILMSEMFIFMVYSQSACWHSDQCPVPTSC